MGEEIERLEMLSSSRRYRVEADDRTLRFLISNEETCLDEAQVQQRWEDAQNIEGYHRGLKPEDRIERCQAGKVRKQCNCIMLALPAFIGLEWKRYTSGLSRWALKQDIIRPAVGAYLPEPCYILDSSTASVLYYNITWQPDSMNLLLTSLCDLLVLSPNLKSSAQEWGWIWSKVWLTPLYVYLKLNGFYN